MSIKLSDKLRRYANPAQPSTMQEDFIDAAHMLDDHAAEIAALEWENARLKTGQNLKQLEKALEIREACNIMVARNNKQAAEIARLREALTGIYTEALGQIQLEVGGKPFSTSIARSALVALEVDR